MSRAVARLCRFARCGGNRIAPRNPGARPWPGGRFVFLVHSPTTGSVRSVNHKMWPLEQIFSLTCGDSVIRWYLPPRKPQDVVWRGGDDRGLAKVPHSQRKRILPGGQPLRTGGTQPPDGERFAADGEGTRDTTDADRTPIHRGGQVAVRRHRLSPGDLRDQGL